MHLALKFHHDILKQSQSKGMQKIGMHNKSTNAPEAQPISSCFHFDTFEITSLICFHNHKPMV